MCADYTPSRRERIEEYFSSQLKLFTHPFAPPDEAFPGSMAPMIRLAPGAAGQFECLPACFGMLPYWADLKLARSTYNARSETVAVKPSFRNAWQRRQFCIIPARELFEPRYDGQAGGAVRWRIEHASGAPLAVAGIWESRPDGPDGQPLLSFSMLTINADQHPLMRNFHKPDDEKRMVVILEPHQYADWLRGRLAGSDLVFRTYPAELLAACADPMPARSRPSAPRRTTATQAPERALERAPEQAPELSQGQLF